MYYGPEDTFPKSTVIPLSGGEIGTDETVAIMRRLVIESAQYPEVKQAAAYAVRGLRPSDFLSYSQALFNYAKKNFQFIPDALGVEEITAPWIHSKRILTQGWTFGDCDDYAVTLASWHNAVGIKTRFAVIASPLNGGFWDHVRAEALIGGTWRPLDATLRRLKYGEGTPSLREMYKEV